MEKKNEHETEVERAIQFPPPLINIQNGTERQRDIQLTILCAETLIEERIDLLRELYQRLNLHVIERPLTHEFPLLHFIIDPQTGICLINSHQLNISSNNRDNGAPEENNFLASFIPILSSAQVQVRSVLWLVYEVPQD